MAIEEQKTDSTAVWSRIGLLEKQSAAQATDIRGIYAGLEEIRDVLVRMQESAKPNLGGMLLVLIATCAFLVTLGGLTMAPVHREQDRSYDAITILAENQNNMRANRFTSADGDALEDLLRAKIHSDEKVIYSNQERIARMEGILIGKDILETLR